MIHIVLPAYNEEACLPPLLAAIRENMDEIRMPYKVVVVDDGSTDRTRAVLEEAAKEMPVRIVVHPKNRGLSEALKTGLLAALEETEERDIIVTMDSDNTHTPGLILRMVRMIREGFDVVIGSRYRHGSRVIGVPANRRLLSFGASIVFRILFPTRGVKDYTSGYRAYRATAVKRMFDAYGDDFIDRPGFSCMVDVLLKMRQHPLVIGEVPLILRYDMKEGASKMDVGKTVRETLQLIRERLFESR
jgi:dolichol-phosphate mannosyltransferase